MGYEQAMELLVYDTGDEESDDAWLHISVWKWTYQKSGIGLGGEFQSQTGEGFDMLVYSLMFLIVPVYSLIFLVF